MENSIVPATEFITRLVKTREVILDVRSEGEFLEGCIPYSTNIPILNNEHRHLVGLTYKEKGNAEAIALGIELTKQVKTTVTQKWIDLLPNGGVLYCWRGGQRSKIAQQWLSEAGFPAQRIIGGYKALRKALSQEFTLPRPQAVLLSGSTGVGKTKFLRSLSSHHCIDLEGLANHRGSSFGGLFLGAQPSQQTFENALAFGLKTVEELFLMENESRLIGKSVIPTPFFEFSRSFPKIILEATWQERIENIFQEYVSTPLLQNEKAKVEKDLIGSLQQIREKLGNERFDEILQTIQRSFLSQEVNYSKTHGAWIESLLRFYYDPMYEYASKKRIGPEIFRGNAAACKEWLLLNKGIS